MKPLIQFECTHQQCSTFGTAASLPDRSLQEVLKLANSDEEKMRYRHCPACHQQGRLTIQHGTHSFASIAEYEKHITVLIETTKLLARLVAAGVGTEEDCDRLNHNKKLLNDARCPCCGRPAIDAIHHAPRLAT